MRYAILHRTRFTYSRPVRFARCNLRLEPIAWDGQTVESNELSVSPRARLTRSHATGYPVNVTRMVMEQAAGELVVDSRSVIRVDRATPVPHGDDPTVGQVAAAARASRTTGPMAPADYLYPSPVIPLFPEIADWCAGDMDAGRGIVEAGTALTRRIRAEFRYDGTATEADTSPRDAFAQRHGVCQDFAQIMISGLRGLGLPAAYVSGYLRTLPPPGKPRLVGADATHAWVLIWCGEARGWIGFDPTNGCLMGEDHIVTAVGRDYHDVSPIDGIFLGTNDQAIDVSVDVEPLDPA